MNGSTGSGLDLSRLRTLYGRSAEFWADPGMHVVEDGRWLTCSGAMNVGLNTALCHGASGGDLIQATLADIKALRVPAAISVAGQALGSVQTLVRESWVCIGAAPFMMIRSLDELPRDGGVRALGIDDLPAARALIAEAFGLPEEFSVFGVPDSAMKVDGFVPWGLFDGGELVSFMGTAIADEVVVVWSMATPARLRRRGYGRRLLFGALSEVSGTGPTIGLLSASNVGEPLYLAAGFSVLERWQMWSRPRWMLAAA